MTIIDSIIDTLTNPNFLMLVGVLVAIVLWAFMGVQSIKRSVAKNNRERAELNERIREHNKNHGTNIPTV